MTLQEAEARMKALLKEIQEDGSLEVIVSTQGIGIRMTAAQETWVPLKEADGT